MAVESGPKAQALTTALAALRVAANKAMTKPTLARIVKHCADNGVDVSDAKVSDWLTGKAVPDSPQEFGLVVGYLNKCAQHGDPSYEQLDLPHWERLRHAAREERRGTQGMRTRRADPAESDRRAELLTSLHGVQVREFIAPIQGLRERKPELRMLAEFCRGEQHSYLWIQGEPWAGKSAVLSTFALDPPPDATVVSFFVTDRLAARNDHTAFTTAVLDQLAILLPEHAPRVQAEVINRDGLRSELLAIAARREAEKQRRLVLVVDGLDEDTGKPSIASLLPALPDGNLRVVVASRYGPRLPIPDGHPLASARRHRLTPSEHAAGIRDRAVTELDALLGGPERNREVLALVTAAQGLSVSELETLSGMPPFEIDRLLRGAAGRSFRAFSPPPTELGEEHDPVYAWAHETLQSTARTRLGGRLLTASLNRLHTWAEEIRTVEPHRLPGWSQQHLHLGWTTETPDFLLSRYFAVLKAQKDLPRMTVLAFDSARHELMHARTGTDWAALSEIRTVQESICEQPDPDLLTTARLARYRDDLHHRNDSIPDQLPAIRARLGQLDRAEALARCIPYADRRDHALAYLSVAVGRADPDRAEAIARQIVKPEPRASAFASLSIAVAPTDPACAARFADIVETIVSDIADPSDRDPALVHVVRVVARNDPARAEDIANEITISHWRDDALEQILSAVAETEPDRFARLADHLEASATSSSGRDLRRRALRLAQVAAAAVGTDPNRVSRLVDSVEAIARNIHDPWSKTSVLASLMRVVAAGMDPTPAVYLLDRLEASARDVPDPAARGSVLAEVAATVARTDPARAQAIANEITTSEIDVQTMATLSQVMVLINPDYALRLADYAEMMSRDVDEMEPRADALAALARVLAVTDPYKAIPLIDYIEAIAHEMTESWQRANTLIDLSQVMITIDPQRAAHLIDQSEDMARSVDDSSSRITLLSSVSEVVAAADPDRAAAIADDIDDPPMRADAIANIAVVLAGAEPDRAESIIDNFTEPWWRAEASMRLVGAMARTDPKRAARLADNVETLANDFSEVTEQASMLAELAVAVAWSDPDRAVRLVDRVETVMNDLPYPRSRSVVAMRLVKALAGTDQARAQTIASKITASDLRDDALVRLVEVMAETDPDHAEALAHEIISPRRRADAVTRAAKVVAEGSPGGTESTLFEPQVTVPATSLDGETRARCKRLLAQAWAISDSGWEMPLRALPAVDPSTLAILAIDVTGEQSPPMPPPPR